MAEIAFILDATEARITPALNLKDLINSGHRVDVVCRNAIAALWWGHKLLRNVVFFAVFHHHTALRISGAELDESTFPRTELSLARLLKDVYVNHANVHGVATPAQPLAEIVHDLQVHGYQLWWLEETGTPLKAAIFPENAPLAFLLGDQAGMSADFYTQFAQNLPRLSIGPRSYLGSACIQLVLGKVWQARENF